MRGNKGSGNGNNSEIKGWSKKEPEHTFSETAALGYSKAEKSYPRHAEQMQTAREYSELQSSFLRNAEGGFDAKMPGSTSRLETKPHSQTHAPQKQLQTGLDSFDAKAKDVLSADVGAIKERANAGFADFANSSSLSTPGFDKDFMKQLDGAKDKIREARDRMNNSQGSPNSSLGFSTGQFNSGQPPQGKGRF